MGQTRMRDRVIARTHEILATHEPLPVKAETEKAIEAVLEAAEARVREEA